MLRSIHLHEVRQIKLTLDAPRLKTIKLSLCFKLTLQLVHTESVERLYTCELDSIEVKNLKNLKYLHFYFHPAIGPAFLSSVEQLKEIHLLDEASYNVVIQQRFNSNRSEPKVFLHDFETVRQVA